MSATIWSTAYRLINTYSEYKIDDRISGNTLKRLIVETPERQDEPVYEDPDRVLAMVSTGAPSSHTATSDIDLHEVLYQEVPDPSQVSEASYDAVNTMMTLGYYHNTGLNQRVQVATVCTGIIRVPCVREVSY